MSPVSQEYIGFPNSATALLYGTRTLNRNTRSHKIQALPLPYQVPLSGNIVYV